MLSGPAFSRRVLAAAGYQKNGGKLSKFTANGLDLGAANFCIFALGSYRD
jgi:hypothetical protein